ncbi:MAG: phosphotransferase [Polyangiaceae bacterium]|nr:phosphotransferase [Polyangiaceae bacterium]
MTPDQTLAAEWAFPFAWTLTAADSGLINETYLVHGHAGPTAVLQRLNTQVFAPVVHEDIEVVTAHIAARGLATPRLIRTRSGALYATDAEGAVWRMLTFVGDRSVAKLADVEDARSAGSLVARFHAATTDLAHEFRSLRGGFHDTEQRLHRLGVVLALHHDHHHRDAVAALRDALFDAWRTWGSTPNLAERVVHGDLKISNIRFTGSEATALIDLDTLGRGTIDAELGDALRSWCNPAHEDETPSFDLELFGAAMSGYAQGAASAARDGSPEPAPDEWHTVIPAIERIALELSARFATDALEECYFGWDPARHATRGDHNLARARSQLALAASVRRARAAASRKLADALAALSPRARTPARG